VLKPHIFLSIKQTFIKVLISNIPLYPEAILLQDFG